MNFYTAPEGGKIRLIIEYSGSSAVLLKIIPFMRQPYRCIDGLNKSGTENGGINMAQLCLGCMKENLGEQKCPHCGFDRSAEQPAPFLPLGVKLQQDNYLVGRKIDNNAEGARYIGYSQTMHAPVIIHEFMPAGICGRAKGKTNVVIRGGYEERYKELNDKFLSYYRNIARMRELTAVALIFDIFTENGVSYTVEEYYDSIPFTEFIERRGGSVDWNTARQLFMPLISALSSLHAAGIGHYAVSPENISVTTAGKLRLTGFAIDDIRRSGTNFEPELMDGCAAMEQYMDSAELTEATDIYGFTATLFYALTGKLPENSCDRKPDGKLPIPTAVFKRLPSHVVTALAGGLQVSPKSRIATFEEMRSQLSAAPTVKAMRTEANRSAMQNQAANHYTPKKGSIPGYMWGILSVLMCLLILAVAGVMWIRSHNFSLSFINNTTAEESVESSALESVDPDMIVIPDLVGQNYNEIASKQNTESDYIVIKANEDVFSEKYKEGEIAEQSPEVDTKANKKVTIVVKVSKGSANRELPVVAGQSVEAAVSSLNELGFIASPGNYSASDTVEAGRVIGYENYNAGDMAPYGAKISINISTGSETSS